MDPGRRRHRIKIKGMTETQDATTGQPIKAWTPEQSLWGSVEPLAGRELFEAHQVIGEVSHKVTVPFANGIDTTKRIECKGRDFEVLSIANTKELDKELVIMCVERT